MGSIMKHFTKKDWLLTVVVFFLTILEVVSALSTIVVMESVISLIVSSGEGAIDTAAIFKYGGIMMAFAVFSVLIGVLINFITVKIATNYARCLRKKMFDRINSFTMEEINKFSTASLITRSTNDIQQIQMAVVNGLRFIFVAPIIAIVAIAMLINKSHSLTWVTALGIILLVITITIVFFIVSPKFKKIQRYTDDLNNVSREHLTGLKVVRAYNAEGYQSNKFESTNDSLTRTQRFVSRTMNILGPTCQLLMNVLGLSIAWIGSYLINADKILLPEIISFQLFSQIVMMAFMMMTMIAIMLPRAAISARRINEVIETKPSVVDKDEVTIPDNKIRGKVEFRHVSFKYPDAMNYAIEDISFTLNKGETLAIIGGTGSGKTTLINMIPRFYDVEEGEVLIDDVNIKDMSQHDLRERLGIVPQHSTLFSGTIESNLKFSNENMSDDNMKEAARIAQATEFIEDKDEKYLSHVSQSGKNLSGGQKQRMSIARAIAKHPEIYIFDDSFSALDFATDKKLRTALKEVTDDSSVIIIAQRIGTIIGADKILVLDKGKIVGMGTHSELLATCKVYQEIAYSQLSKEELDNARS